MKAHPALTPCCVSLSFRFARFLAARNVPRADPLHPAGQPGARRPHRLRHAPRCRQHHGLRHRHRENARPPRRSARQSSHHHHRGPASRWPDRQRADRSQRRPRRGIVSAQANDPVFAYGQGYISHELLGRRNSRCPLLHSSRRGQRMGRRCWSQNAAKLPRPLGSFVTKKNLSP